ncbi:hypothetical protein [Nocardia africana]
MTTPAWKQCMQQLLAAPVDSAEHRLGEMLATADDDRAWSLLIDMITQDPAETPEYQAAARTLGRLAEPEVA